MEVPIGLEPPQCAMGWGRHHLGVSIGPAPTPPPPLELWDGGGRGGHHLGVPIGAGGRIWGSL